MQNKKEAVNEKISINSIHKSQSTQKVQFLNNFGLERMVGPMPVSNFDREVSRADGLI